MTPQEILLRIDLPDILLAGLPSRVSDIRSLVPDWPTRRHRLRVHRNHSFAFDQIMLGPFSRDARYWSKADLSDCDDSLSFSCLSGESYLELLRHDFSHRALDTEKASGWLDRLWELSGTPQLIISAFRLALKSASVQDAMARPVWSRPRIHLTPLDKSPAGTEKGSVREQPELQETVLLSGDAQARIERETSRDIVHNGHAHFFDVPISEYFLKWMKLRVAAVTTFEGALAPSISVGSGTVGP